MIEEEIRDIFALCEQTGMEPDDIIALRQTIAIEKIAGRMR